ncbi:Similar to hypothetical protein [Tuber melanosporum Mel28]; acc. no. XP_002842553 [Pyronema omphalodes CBS 100304]|uniref:Uncharacterized protein n=1 Tax=Pyronema omphalodes (strain CBS 100304) TaxID=1076935 RepID=U4LK95_PYROM|nr:Similar to hypothetical protein [Tuber melanosporum Mel28]; acc. no. XP_002842553 [Pyronema omphalodes CBS 100304]
MSFWDGMQLWEKMLFVLAGGIVCTLLYATGKLIYNKRRVKRHTMIAAAAKAHLENVRSSRHVIQLKSDDVPFGVKALESGIEIEGIVISRSVTPDSYRRSQQTLVALGEDGASTRGQNSPTPSVANQQMRQTGRSMMYQPTPYIAFPAPVHPGNAGESSMRSSPPGPLGSSPADIFACISCVALWFVNTKISHREYTRSHHPCKTGGATITPATWAQKKKSFTNHSPSHSRSHSRTPTPPDGQRTPTTLPSVHEDSTGESSSRESDSSIENDGVERPRRPGLVATSYSSPVIPSHVPETAYGDLSLLHSHRLSHAAEVGQLLPRTNRNSRVLSAAGIINPSPTSATTENMIRKVYAYDIDLAGQIAVPTPAVLRAEGSERADRVDRVVKRDERAEAADIIEQSVIVKNAEHLDGAERPIGPEPDMSLTTYKKYTDALYNGGEGSRFVEDLWSESTLSVDGAGPSSSLPSIPMPLTPPPEMVSHFDTASLSSTEGEKGKGLLSGLGRLKKKRKDKGKGVEVDLEAQV